VSDTEQASELAPKKDVRLDVLSAKREKPRSKMGPRRAWVLLLVHVAILLHIAHWLASGESLSPVEPSETMYTLIEGELNAGAVFFGAALLSTLVLGRLFCGWGCHVVALQDASLWFLKKVKLRPSPFRSRLLLYFPLGLALYMFVWPAVKRWVVAPALESAWPEGLAYIGAAPNWAHLENAFVVEDFWATFPTLWVAIPFIFVIGFAVIYTLGAKGFCTYACPYGGFFAPIDKVAPMRIVVDHDKCAECGVCTAVCTSNVRVSEEIKDFGMVVDPGCMKCLDCVSACPSDALAYKLTTPPFLGTNPREPEAGSAGKRRKKPKKPVTKARWDMSWPEEIALALFFMVAFISLRGLYGVVPMLFAGGLAAIAAWIVWKAWKTLTTANVRIHGFQLRRKGRVTGWGGAYLLATGVMLAFIGHSAALSLHWASGMNAVNRVALVADGTIQGDIQTHYERAARSFERVHEMGFASTPKTDFELAIVYHQLGEYDKGEAAMRRVIAREGEQDGLIVDHAQLMLAQGGRGFETVDYLNDVLERHPDFRSVRWLLGDLYMNAGEIDDAVRVYRAGVEARPGDHEGFVRLAQAEMAAQRPAAAAEAMARVVELAPDAAGFRKDYAVVLEYAGRRDEAYEQITRAVEDADESVKAPFLRLAAGMAYRTGRQEEAQRLSARADEIEREKVRENPGP